MKIITVLTMIAAAAAVLIPGGAYAGRENIVDYLDKKGAIKVYVKDLVNASDSNEINTAALKRSFEEALAARKSHTFTIVQSRKDADIMIDVEVTEYVWTKDDPVDMVAGITTAAYDVLTKENYARIQVIAKVLNAVSGERIWRDKIKATVTSKTVTREESYGILYERIAKELLKRLFKRPASGYRTLG
ncbi:MAG: hypothetical protein ABIJ27_06185 [Candidatus Omnitrophota bacterium]